MPTIRELHARGQQVADAVIAENSGRWEGVTDADRERIELLARTVAQRLLHEPTVRLRDQGPDGSHGRIETVREVFGLDGSAHGAEERSAGPSDQAAADNIVALPPRRDRG